MNQADLWNFNLKIFNIGGYVKRLKYFITNGDVIYAPKKNTLLKCDDNKRKKAYVMGLGPSLRNVNFNKIDGDTIVVNRFYLIGKEHPDFVPTYYIIIDFGFADIDNLQDFNNAINMYAKKGTKFILNSKFAHSPVLDFLPDECKYFVSCIDGKMKKNKQYRIDGLFPAFQNVTGAAILLLMLMEYKSIYLLGCDFNSFASTTRNHCYKDKIQTRLHPMYQELFASSFMAKDHMDLQVYAERVGCTITNSTKGSLIDAYPLEIDENLYIKENS